MVQATEKLGPPRANVDSGKEKYLLSNNRTPFTHKQCILVGVNEQ